MERRLPDGNPNCRGTPAFLHGLKISAKTREGGAKHQ